MLPQTAAARSAFGSPQLAEATAAAPEPRRSGRERPPPDDAAADREWIVRWLGAVADGSSTMSQRKLTSIDGRGGLDALKAVAEEMGFHLLLLEDDKGDPLIAASTRPSRVVC